MLKIIYLLSLLLCVNCREKYLDRVLDSRNSNRYFILVTAKINGVENEIIVINKNLYSVMKSKDQKLGDKELYKKYIKDMIHYKRAIALSEEDCKIMDAAIIKLDSNLIDSLRNNNTSIIKNYFFVSDKYNYAVLNHNVDNRMIGAIMKLMFESNYLMSMIEGRLTIEELNFCKE